MTTIESSSPVILRAEAPFTFGEDQLAAVAFLARHRGRTLEGLGTESASPIVVAYRAIGARGLHSSLCRG
jgi:hypothetical protein